MLKALYILLMVGISLIPIYLGFHAEDGRLLNAIGVLMLIISFIIALTVALEAE